MVLKRRRKRSVSSVSKKTASAESESAGSAQGPPGICSQLVEACGNQKTLYLACTFALLERLLKIILVGGSLETLLTEKGATMTPRGGMLMVRCALLLGVRYVFASHRHIFALRAGTEAQIRTLHRYQNHWLQISHGQHNTLHSLLQKVGEGTVDCVSRVAIDLVPGLVSIVLGCYSYLCLVACPHAWYALAFLFAVDVFHRWLCTTHTDNETRLAERCAGAVARVHAIGQESISYVDTVHAFARSAMEIFRFDEAGAVLKNTRNEYHRIANYQGSFRHWVGHLVNAGIIWIGRDHVRNSAHLVMLLVN